jgi:predicted anti-sigma-YlaC factor YlaD
MNRCDQARRLFGVFWDDEVTQAEREWLESHFTACPECRAQYDQLARTLETIGSLPRTEIASDLPERALLAARRAGAVPDRVAAAPVTPRWVPVTATAALLLVVGALLLPAVVPFLGPRDTNLRAAAPAADVAEPRLIASAVPDPAAARPAVTLADSLFDHSEDVEFILDPVVLHRGRAQSATRLPEGVQGEQTVISF